MDALHLLQDLKTQDKWSKVRLVGLTGSEDFLASSLKLIKEKQSDNIIVNLYPKSDRELFEAISQTDVNVEPRLYIAHSGLDVIDEASLLKIERLSRKNYFPILVVLTGNLPKTVDSKDIFTGKVAQRYYQLDFKKTETGQERAKKWVQYIAQCDVQVADKIASLCEFDISRMYQLAQKVAYFDNMTPQAVPLLVDDYLPGHFAISLAKLNYVEAMSLAKEIPPTLVPWVIYLLSNYTRTISQIYPLTRQVRIPTRQQVIDSKLTMATLQRWWDVAGRYPPEQQIRRNILLTQASHRYYTTGSIGVLEKLVLSW